MILSIFLTLFFLTSGVFSNCNVLYQLDDMSICKIGQSFEAYRYYGCSCSGVAPDKPLDGIDRCCQMHNSCYDYLISSKRCQSANAPFFCLYKWQCMSQQPTCDNENKCLQSVCECDEQFINCLSRFPYPTFARKCPYYDGDPLMKILTTTKRP